MSGLKLSPKFNLCLHLSSLSIATIEITIYLKFKVYIWYKRLFIVFLKENIGKLSVHGATELAVIFVSCSWPHIFTNSSLLSCGDTTAPGKSYLMWKIKTKRKEMKTVFLILQYILFQLVPTRMRHWTFQLWVS